ncbi:MAG: MinD/ParA family protein [Haloarculaceae archaeon]
MLAIAGGKGGSGKTTTTVGLARELASRGTNPVVVDADCDMPDLHVVADAPLEPGLGAVANGRTERGVHRGNRVPGVRVVPAGTAATAGPALERLGGDDPILVDCPAGASAAVGDVLRVADRSLVVTTPDRQSLEDAAKTAAMARALDAPPVGAVLTRSTERLPLEDLLDCPCVAATPPVEAGVLSETAVRQAYDRVVSHLQGQNV